MYRLIDQSKAVIRKSLHSVHLLRRQHSRGTVHEQLSAFNLLTAMNAFAFASNRPVESSETPVPPSHFARVGWNRMLAPLCSSQWQPCPPRLYPPAAPFAPQTHAWPSIHPQAASSSGLLLFFSSFVDRQLHLTTTAQPSPSPSPASQACHSFGSSHRPFSTHALTLVTLSNTPI